MNTLERNLAGSQALDKFVSEKLWQIRLSVTRFIDRDKGLPWYRLPPRSPCPAQSTWGRGALERSSLLQIQHLLQHQQLCFLWEVNPNDNLQKWLTMMTLWSRESNNPLKCRSTVASYQSHRGQSQSVGVYIRFLLVLTTERYEGRSWKPNWTVKEAKGCSRRQ